MVFGDAEGGVFFVVDYNTRTEGADMIQLWVEFYKEPWLLILHLPKKSTISSLYDSIYDRLGIPIAAQNTHYLRFHSQTLFKSSEILATCGIEEDATIKVLCRLFGGGGNNKRNKDGRPPTPALADMSPVNTAFRALQLIQKQEREKREQEEDEEAEEADEEEPADDEECHRCEQTGLLLKGSKVTYGAWSCAKCEAELEVERDRKRVAECDWKLVSATKMASEIDVPEETAKDVADMTREALVSPATLNRQVDGKVNDSQQLIDLGSPDTQERQVDGKVNDSQQVIDLVSPDAHGQPPPPDQHPDSDFIKALGNTVPTNTDSASQIPALKVMDSA
jgi:hypothetical protein